MFAQDNVITLAADVPVRLETLAGFFALVAADAPIEISVDNTGYQSWRLGDVANNYPGGVLWVKSSTAQTITLKTGSGEFIPNGQAVAVSVAATVAPGTNYVPGVDVSVPSVGTAAVSAANLSRLSITITNPPTNQNTMRLGVPLNVGAGKGDALAPGESITLACTGAISAYNPGSPNAAAESLIWSEVTA